MIYPEGISLFQPAELAKAVAHFLKDNHFASRSAVIGIPLKWLVVKPKEVPPADDATVAQLLRLEAEAEFSTELKDLVYDFAGDPLRAAHRAPFFWPRRRKNISMPSNRFATARGLGCWRSRLRRWRWVR